MKLEAFRVQNYKKIRDTGWVSCRDLTCFVGKNEAGKSAIFRGLSKLNPSDGEKYDGLKEFPRRRYTDEFADQDWPVATGKFLLDAEEREELGKITPLLKDVKTVEVTRYYSWNLTVGFDPAPKVTTVSCRDIRDAIDEAIRQVQDLTAPDGKGDVLGNIKQACIGALQKTKNSLPNDGNATKAQVDQAINAIATHANEQWQKDLLAPILEPFRGFADWTLAQENLATARKWVAEYLPKFIYFDKYDVIDSAIYIPSFVTQVQNNQGGPRIRTTHCLFKHVGLEIKQLANLGRHQPNQGESPEVRRQVDERAILTSSASNAMTQKFADWWEQRKHQFRYQLDFGQTRSCI